MSSTFRIWANKQELENLPKTDSYLFFNYKWKKHPAFQNTMEFESTEYQEAAALYHELWRSRIVLPSLVKSWA
jgi:hypothetical protein